PKNASIPGRRTLQGTNRSQWRRAGTTTTCSAGKGRTRKKTAPMLPYLLHSRKKGTKPKCMGTRRQKKLPEQLTAQPLPSAARGEKQARIVARGKTSEHRRTLIERTWLYR